MFEPGVSGNPKGKAKGKKNGFSLTDLCIAIRKVSKHQKRNLYEHFVQRAYENDKVLIALMKKILPDKVYHEDDHEDLIDNYLDFSDVPKNGDGEHRFSKFIT